MPAELRAANFLACADQVPFSSLLEVLSAALQVDLAGLGSPGPGRYPDEDRKKAFKPVKDRGKK